MITYSEYMADSSNLHQAFYLEVAKAAGISYANSEDLPKIAKALKHDENLNNIPLYIWDRWAIFTARAVGEALKARGTFYSLASGVCAHKAAAREAARQYLNQQGE